TRPAARSALDAAPAALGHLAALAVVAMLLVSAGQPLLTEDTWWHLSLGAAHVAAGPWLGADPVLHTAAGPPVPAAWLTGVLFHAVERIAGFSGLRVLHAALVAGILALAFGALRRASGSLLFASVATALFGALSAYRLFQLRPHLFSILACLLFIGWLVGDGRAPTRARIAAGAAGVALWANLHAAFLLGPILLTAALAGLAIDGLLRPERRAAQRRRGARLALASAVALAASLANPAGVQPHLSYFVAGGATPSLDVVADEWASFPLFAGPLPGLPPSPLAWGVVWGLLVLLPCAVLLAERRTRRCAAAPGSSALDPAMVGVAAASLVAMLSAVRFLWLGVFVLIVLGQCARALCVFEGPRRRRVAWSAAAVCVLLVPGFARFGAWPMISRGIQAETYGWPYPTPKYHAHAVWFLHDAGLEGRLFNDYGSGNFLGYWLAPRLKVFLNGSLNVPRSVMDARNAITSRSGDGGTGFGELLDRYAIDVFFGTGIPAVSSSGRPSRATTTHLEGAPGWIRIFRNLQGAVYLRDLPRNRENLDRVAAYYRDAGVPFDRQAGFETDRVISRTPRWAVERGLIPEHFAGLRAGARSQDAPTRDTARANLSAIYLALGLYERAEATDRRLLRSDPETVATLRRLLWSLLHQRRAADALEVAEQLSAAADPADELSALLVEATNRLPGLSDGDGAAVVASLPIFTPEQGRWLYAGWRWPEARNREH
ncbi:MAG: tetratricopeptide repeat protein, partial [Myxococcota bacterium]